MSPIFADLHAVLSAADCHKLGYNVFLENPCDLWRRIYVYGSPWLQLGKLGLTASDVFWLGLVINATFMLLAVALINPSNIAELQIGVAVLLSPAITLAVERANNDLIIFGLSVLAAWLVAGQHRSGQIAGLLVTLLSAALKIYPAVLFGVIALVSRTRKEFLSAAIGGICLVGVWVYLSADELVLLHGTVPRPDQLATGSTLLVRYICPTCPIFKISLAVAAIAAIALSMAMFLSQKLQLESLSRHSFVIFCFGLAVLLFTFLANSNYDYRWVFFVMLVPMLLEISRGPQSHGLAKKLTHFTIGCVLFVMWCEAFPQAESLQRCIWIVKQVAAWLSLTLATAIAIGALRTIGILSFPKVILEAK